MLPHNAGSLAPGAWERLDPAATAQPLWPVAPRALYGNRGSVLRADLGDRGLVAKRPRDGAAARRLHELLEELARGCPHVPAPILLEDAGGGAPWLCAPYLEGGPWHERDGPQEAFAAALASLHGAMRALAAEDVARAGAGRAARLMGWLRAQGESGEVARLAAVGGLDARGLAERLEAWLASPSQPVHNDLHGGNVWWSDGRIWFLDYEELPDSHLPPIADLMRYTERHLLVTSGTGADRARYADAEALWAAYWEALGEPVPGAAEAFAAMAWNWLDAWATLHLLQPRPPGYAGERRKFLALLEHHERHWARFAARLEALR